MEETAVEETAVPGREQVPWRKQQSPPSRHYPNLGHPIKLDLPQREDGGRPSGIQGSRGYLFLGWGGGGGRAGRKFFRKFQNKHAGSTDLCACSTDLLPVGRRKKKRREKLPFFVENYEL